MLAEVMTAERSGARSGRQRGAPGRGPGIGASTGAIRLTLPADPDSVRAALIRIATELVRAGIAEEDAATAELVLAEVLNNVVEHAFCGCSEGRIEVTIAPEEADLACEVRNNGHPMPGGALPAGVSPVCGQAPEALPEGGFGWFLIHSLTREIAYARDAGANLLGLRIPLSARPCPRS
jgi:serine/threonine-protein kinase RsbW